MANQEMRTEARSSLGTVPAVGSADASKAADHSRTVIVPRRPGPLRQYQPRSPRPRDELDELIDELFGPTTNEKPGRFDAGQMGRYKGGRAGGGAAFNHNQGIRLAELVRWGDAGDGPGNRGFSIHGILDSSVILLEVVQLIDIVWQNITGQLKFSIDSFDYDWIGHVRHVK